MKDSKFFSIKELSSYIGIKPKTIYSWLGKSVIPHYRIQGLIRFKVQEIDNWLKSCHKREDDLISKKNNRLEDDFPSATIQPTDDGKPGLKLAYRKEVAYGNL